MINLTTTQRAKLFDRLLYIDRKVLKELGITGSNKTFRTGTKISTESFFFYHDVTSKLLLTQR